MIVKGALLVPEKDVVLKRGALVGELGMFAQGNRRTASAVAQDEVELLAISYGDVMQLCAQSPAFCFYLMRLMMNRMERNVELAGRAASASPG